jgi:hypothetical protein
MDVGHYLFAITNEERTPVMVSLKSYDMSNFYSKAIMRKSFHDKQLAIEKERPLFEVKFIK